MVTALFASAARARTIALPSFDGNRRHERSSIAVAELDALKRSVDQLRETLGEAVVRPDDRQHNAFTYEIDQQVDNDFWPQTEHSRQHPLRHGQKDHWKRRQFDSPESVQNSATTTFAPFEGIMNIKAGIRTITAATADDSFIPAPSRRSGDSNDAGDGDVDDAAEEAPVDDDADVEQSAEDDSPSADKLSHRARHRHHNRNNRRRRKGCPTNKHGRKQIMCPSKSSRNYDVCIIADQLCDGIEHCPEGEDEHPTNCLFYKTTKEHLKQVYNTVVALADHVVKSEDRREDLHSVMVLLVIRAQSSSSVRGGLAGVLLCNATTRRQKLGVAHKPAREECALNSITGSNRNFGRRPGRSNRIDDRPTFLISSVRPTRCD
uniref:Uncharacterized protein n=1 Tax=Plectus sambesii TaxID=2011161 RepID=A0A914W016_9BILA